MKGLPEQDIRHYLVTSTELPSKVHAIIVTGESDVVILTKISKHDLQTPTEYGKVIDINVAYPRRNFSIISDVETDYRYFMSEITLIQHKLNENHAYGYRFDWRKLESKVNRHRVAMLLFHPSFQKVSTYTYTYLELLVNRIELPHNCINVVLYGKMEFYGDFYFYLD